MGSKYFFYTIVALSYLLFSMWLIFLRNASISPPATSNLVQTYNYSASSRDAVTNPAPEKPPNQESSFLVESQSDGRAREKNIKNSKLSDLDQISSKRDPKDIIFDTPKVDAIIGDRSSERSISEIISDFHPVRVEFKIAVEAYIKMHKSAIASRDKNVKYLHFSPSGQLCNRMRGAIAAFTLAFLTDRVFILSDFGYRETRSFYDLFKSPGFDIEATTGMSSRNSESIETSVDVGANSRSKVELFTCTDWSKNENDLFLSGTDYTVFFILSIFTF